MQMQRGASPASPGRKPLSSLSSNSPNPRNSIAAKPKGFFRSLVSQISGDDRVPVDPTVLGPAPPISQKRAKKITDSSKKRKHLRRQRGTVLVDDFGFTVDLSSPDTPLEYEETTPSKTPTRKTTKSPSSKSKGRSRRTPTKSTPRELINGDKVGKKVRENLGLLPYRAKRDHGNYI